MILTTLAGRQNFTRIHDGHRPLWCAEGAQRRITGSKCLNAELASSSGHGRSSYVFEDPQESAEEVVPWGSYRTQVRFHLAATSSIARYARCSKPVGVSTQTSQLCSNGQRGPARNGRRNFTCSPSSGVLIEAATRFSSFWISAAVCCDLDKARTPAFGDVVPILIDVKS